MKRAGSRLPLLLKKLEADHPVHVGVGPFTGVTLEEFAVLAIRFEIAGEIFLDAHHQSPYYQSNGAEYAEAGAAAMSASSNE